jgi:hypothetical protein
VKAFLFVSPTILRVIRVARVGRILRLVKGARGIRTLLFALAVSMPALVNIGLLLFLIIFIYAIFGMNFFMHVGYSDNLNGQFNFETIFRSMVTLFPLCTSAGWSVYLESTSFDGPPKCNPNLTTASYIAAGDCGNNAVAVPFFVTFLVITFLVVINMYIAVILENFNLAKEEVQQGLTDDDYDMYYERWQMYDPKCTQFIKYDKLSEFIDSLDEPLRIPQPNKYKIINMNIPICENDIVFCVDILDALTKYFLGADAELESNLSEDKTIKNKPANYKPYTTTLEKQRLDYSSKVIANAVRKHIKKRMSD